MSDNHREAVAHLLYSLKQSGGFVQLTGEVGTGKTTVCRYLLQHLPKNVDVALLLNPRVNEQELLQVICDELHIHYPPEASLKQLVSLLNKYLLAFHGVGRYTVLIIDEAQNLSREALEQIRLLTNLETSTDKLLQIILIGQPELVHMLGQHDLRQVSQRIIGRYHLAPLNLKETGEYISYRLGRAGCKRELFSGAAIRQIHRFSKGVPRIINVLCDSALMGAYSENRIKVDRRIVTRAAAEVMQPVQKTGFLGNFSRVALIPLVLVLIVFGMLLSDYRSVFSRFMAKSENTEVRSIEPSHQPADTGQTAETQQLASSGVTGPSPSSSAVVSTDQTDNNKVTSRFDLIYRLGVPYKPN